MPNLVEDMPQAATAPVAATHAPQPRSRRKYFIGIGLLVVAGTATAAYFHYLDRVTTDDATVDGHVSSVAPKVAGNVVEVLVNDNQQVKAGDVLVRIDPRDFEAKVAQARAALLQAESQARAANQVIPWTVDTTRSAVTAANAQLTDAVAEQERAKLGYEQAFGAELAYAEANIRARQAANDRAQADLARMKPLADKSEISSLQYDSFVAAARVAESELRAAEQRLVSAQKEAAIKKAAADAATSKVSHAKALLASSEADRKQVPIRSADAGTASAAVEAARASLQAAELQLSYTTITAPMDGLVTRKSVEVGQIVAPGQALMAVVPLHDVWVTANFKETQLANVRPGQRAVIHVDMYNRKISGKVDSIAGATGSRLSLLPAENATGNFVKVVQRIPVKILVDRQEGLTLRPGMNVDATIFTK